MCIIGKLTFNASNLILRFLFLFLSLLPSAAASLQTITKTVPEEASGLVLGIGCQASISFRILNGPRLYACVWIIVAILVCCSWALFLRSVTRHKGASRKLFLNGCCTITRPMTCIPMNGHIEPSAYK